MPKNNFHGLNRMLTSYDEPGGVKGKGEHNLLTVDGNALICQGQTLTSLRRW